MLGEVEGLSLQWSESDVTKQNKVRLVFSEFRGGLGIGTWNWNPSVLGPSLTWFGSFGSWLTSRILSRILEVTEAEK